MSRRRGIERTASPAQTPRIDVVASGDTKVSPVVIEGCRRRGAAAGFAKRNIAWPAAEMRSPRSIGGRSEELCCAHAPAEAGVEIPEPEMGEGRLACVVSVYHADLAVKALRGRHPRSPSADLRRP